MGQKQSTLQHDEISYFTTNTPCNANKIIFICLLEIIYCLNLVSVKEIKRLYKRFQQLDRQSFGSIIIGDLLSIPELAMNPLSKHFLDFVFNYSVKKNDDEFIEEKSTNGMDFENFVDIMSFYHTNTPLEVKFKCKYR